MKTQIIVDKVDENNGRFVLKSASGELYSFFQNKKSDGSVTTAYQGYTKIRPIKGDTVIAEVNDNHGTDKSGAPKVYHNIMWFYTDGAAMETAQAPKPVQEEIPTIRMEDLEGETATTVPAATTDDTMRIVNSLADRVKVLENRLSLVESVVTGVNDDSGDKININDVPF